jgi:hypothetical protein
LSRDALTREKSIALRSYLKFWAGDIFPAPKVNRPFARAHIALAGTSERVAYERVFPNGHNKSLDANGGSVFLNLLGAAEGALIRAAASTQTLCAASYGRRGRYYPYFSQELIAMANTKQTEQRRTVWALLILFGVMTPLTYVCQWLIFRPNWSDFALSVLIGTCMTLAGAFAALLVSPYGAEDEKRLTKVSTTIITLVTGYALAKIIDPLVAQIIGSATAPALLIADPPKGLDFLHQGLCNSHCFSPMPRLTTHSTGARIALPSCARLALIQRLVAPG